MGWASQRFLGREWCFWAGSFYGLWLDVFGSGYLGMGLE